MKPFYLFLLTEAYTNAASDYLLEQIENEIADASKLPGMTKENGKLVFNGEEVVGINGIKTPEEVGKINPIEDLQPVETIEPVEKLESVKRTNEVEKIAPLTFVKELLSKIKVDTKDVKSISPVEAQEVESLTPVVSKQEVESMEEVVGKIEVPEAVANSLLKGMIMV